MLNRNVSDKVLRDGVIDTNMNTHSYGQQHFSYAQHPIGTMAMIGLHIVVVVEDSAIMH